VGRLGGAYAETGWRLRGDGPCGCVRALMVTSLRPLGRGRGMPSTWLAGNLTGDELAERAEGGNGVCGMAYAAAEAHERLAFCGR
jgi:hypothetical protein